MAEIVWRRCWGGPLDGRAIEFPPDMRYLPVSRSSGEPRIGRHLRDWNGTLLGHYYEFTDGQARFLPTDSSSPLRQADGNPSEDGELGG